MVKEKKEKSNIEKVAQDFSDNVNVRVNAITGLKIYLFCSLCGVEGTSNNLTEMHRIRKTKKEKFIRLSEIMKSLC